MTVRTEIVDLIELVRGLISDPKIEGVTPEFTDEQIQSELDLEKEYHFRLALKPLPNLDGSVYKWFAPLNFWDKDTEIGDLAGTVFTPSEANYIAGQFTLDDEKDESVITGYCYDVYAVCANLLTVWAGRIGREVIKFSADGSSFEFAGEIENKLKQASLYKSKSRRYGGLRVLGMVRNDHVTN